MSGTIKILTSLTVGMILTVVAGMLMPRWVMWGILIIVGLTLLWAFLGSTLLGIHLLSGWLIDRVYMSGKTLDSYHSSRLRRREQTGKRMANEFPGIQM
jgi:hypothetical protein